MVSGWNWRKLAFIAMVTALTLSCGRRDKYGRYVPLVPFFKYKNRKDNIQPKNLDLENIYRLKLILSSGEQSYPKDGYDNPMYMKFYPNGRYTNFGVYSVNGLSVSYLDPSNRDGPQRGYYFSPDGKEVKVEIFHRGDGGGLYIRHSYHLSITGDTLTRIEKNFYKIYVKELLPDSLKKEYKIDW
jgi:hypothetical protein